MRWLIKRKTEKTKADLLHKQILRRTALFVIGAFISALSFNLFFVPNNFVSGGLGGIAIILNNFITLDTTMVIIIGNALFIILSIIILGFKESIMSIVGAAVFTLFVFATESIPHQINFYFDDMLLYVLAAGVVGGFGESLVYKAGFNTGGTSIIALIIQKYKKEPLGKILRIFSVIIILVGGITFGYTAIMYSLIISAISTYLVDRIMIGISDSKTFFIQTSKEEEVKDFILRIIESGVTEFDTKGAFSHLRKKMLMCVVPTEKYSFLKSAIREIDSNAFIVVSDCYEVYGGTKRKKMSLDN